MIDQVQATRLIHPSKQRHLRISRPTPEERTARVVADTADDRCADAGRPDHRVRFPAVGLERLLELVEGRTGQADDLPTLVNHEELGNMHRVDDHDVSVVAAGWGGTTREPRIGRLHDDDFLRCHAGLKHTPLLNE